MTYADEVLADAPLLYWRFDGSAANGSVVTDASGNGHDGTLIGTAASAPSLLVGDDDGAFAFDGNEYVTILWASWMNVASLTVEALVKTTATGIKSLWDRDSSANNPRVFQFRLNAGKVEFIAINSSAGVVTVTSPGAVNDGNVHHIAATCSASAINVYIDGSLAATHAGVTLSNQNSELRFGANRSSGFNALYNGVADEAAYYGAVLSPARITAHHDASVAAAPAGPTVLPSSAVSIPITVPAPKSRWRYEVPVV